MLYALARPLLFRLDPERAHELTLGLADAPLRLGLLRVARAPGAPVRAMGLEFPNAVGLAAGLDKNAEHVDALARGERVLIVDDVLATGGTASAVVDLVRKAGGDPAALSFLIELSFLNGRTKLDGLAVEALIRY